MTQALLLTRGLMASGKSTLSRALGAELGWPVVDKDDINDVLIDRVKDSGPLAYEAMFSLADSLLAQGFSVICDSPLRGEIGYRHAKALAEKVRARLYVLECSLRDETLWRERIETRTQRPAHIIRSWQELLDYRRNVEADFTYTVSSPALQLDMADPLTKNVERVVGWLRAQGARIQPKEISL